MAARVSMCACRQATSIFKPVRVFNLEKQRNLSYSVSSKRLLETSRFYKSASFVCKNVSTTSLCTASKGDNIGGLADEILKSKLAAESKKHGSKSGGDQKANEDEDKQKSANFQKKAMKYTFIAFGSLFIGTAGFCIVELGAPPKDSEGNVVIDEFSEMPKIKAYIMRTYREFMYYDKMIKEPSREKLLPDPLTEPYYQPPFTLVLEMTGVLVHPDWTYQTGWRFKKRPWVDYFLQQVGPPMFEVVVYTSEQGFTAFPILDTLDPNGYIMYRLFRDATRYVNGHHVKDLSCLNRDLSKVIFLDWNEKSFQLQPRNSFKLKKWSGNDDDKTLFELANFLRTVASSGVEDVRTVLEYYNQFDDPLSIFKENQKKLKEEEERKIAEDKDKKTLVGLMTGGFTGRK